VVHSHTTAGTVLYTDEWVGYGGVDRPTFIQALVGVRPSTDSGP
jgi:hypothetical protein